MKNSNNSELVLREPVNRIIPDINSGLNNSQVNERINKGWDNKAVEPPTKTVKQIFFTNIVTYFNIIFFIIALALLFVGSFKNMTFLVVIITNIAIGIIQEIRSKKTLDNLTILSQPKVNAIRNGKKISIYSDRIVIDDLVYFSAGNQICADAVIVSGEVSVNEALITGEADEISKKAGDKLLSGSYVVSGECLSCITAVGKDSFASQLTLKAQKSKKSKDIGLKKSLKTLIMIISFVIIPIGVIMLIKQSHFPIAENITSTAAAIIGMIPDGLYLLVSVTLAVSVIKLAKKETLVHDLNCIETLARVDTVCVDKTGTITDNSMLVSNIIPISSSLNPTEIIKDFVCNMPDDNITMKTLKKYFGSVPYVKASKVNPFSSATKSSSVVFPNNESYVLGAPEFILQNNYQNYISFIEPHIKVGKRVLLFASVSDISDNGYGRVTPLAIITLINPVRKEAPDTFRYFKEQGVNIKVISGDNPFTVSAAAKEAGISGYEKFIDLNGLSDDEVIEAAEKFTVFGRVKPEQKRLIVKSLKENGHTVAMTGDGVNDILALREADCSIALASGSDVACQVSHLVLLNSDFSSLPSIVAEGRQVINNIERSASLFLVKNIFSFVLALISIFASIKYPFEPIQISLISAVTIGIPSFVLALEKNNERIHGNFIANVIYAALPAALTDIIVVIGVLMFMTAYEIPKDISYAICTILMALVGFTMVFKMCHPFTKIRAAMMITIVVLFLLAIFILPDLFCIVAPDFGGWLVLSVFTLLIPSVIFSMTSILKWLKKALSTIFKSKEKLL